MLFKIVINKFRTVFGKRKPQKSNLQPINLSTLREGNLIRVVPFSDFFDTCSNEINAVKYVAGLSPEVFDFLLLPTIKTAAEYMFSLPASQIDHHREAGGLFRHSLEVGRSSLLMATGNVWDLSDDPGTRRKQIEKMYAVAFLAGFFHDFGKVATDFTVHCGHTGAQWSRYQSSLSSWVENSKVKTLMLKYRLNRKDKHKKENFALAFNAMTEELKLWLSEDDGEELEMLLTFLANQDSDERNYAILQNNVEKADQASVNNYMKKIGEDVRIGQQLFHHLTSYLFENREKINKSGSQIWHLKQGVFIVWPEAYNEILEQVPHELKKHFRHEHETLVRKLQDFRHVEIYLDENNKKHILWPFSPDILNGKGRTVVLYGLKISINPDIYRYLPPAMDGQIGGTLKGADQNHKMNLSCASTMEEVLHLLKKKKISSISKSDLKEFLEGNSCLKPHEFLWEMKAAGFTYRLEGDEIFIEK